MELSIIDKWIKEIGKIIRRIEKEEKLAEHLQKRCITDSNFDLGIKLLSGVRYLLLDGIKPKLENFRDGKRHIIQSVWYKGVRRIRTLEEYEEFLKEENIKWQGKD